MDTSERLEQLIAFLGSQLPQPVEEGAGRAGSLTFTGGDPPEVVVELTNSSVIVSEFAGRWDGASYGLTPRPRRVGALNWRRLPETPLMNALLQLIRGASEMRRARFRTCRLCESVNAPEWMYNNDVCYRCSERERGQVH